MAALYHLLIGSVMKKIILLCAAGMSTSLLVNKMRKVAEDETEQYEIEAYPVAEAAEKAADADVILLGPQVRFQESKVKKLLPNSKVVSIDMSAYGTMNGKLVLEQAKKIIEEI
jgi:PTS system cellobiose-specific IIB component